MAKEVAATLPAAVPWLALLLRGITDYARGYAQWTLITSPPTLSGAEEVALSVATLRGWPGDGVITQITTKTEARIASELGIPVVNISSVLREVGVPSVVPDQVAIGRMAAEHLLGRGLRRLAFYGFKNVWYSHQRYRGFAECIEQTGGECSLYEQPTPTTAPRSWQERTAGLEQWIETLKTPVGIMAVQDYRACAVIDACNKLRLRVPDDVALIGVDNDETLCEFCRPTLSSISRGGYKIGYEAAALLDRLMAGEPPPEEDVLMTPEGIVDRQSTDVVAVDDAHVAAAARYVREHVDKPFGVNELLHQVSISRRQFENLFQRYLRCTPHEYICRARVDRAKQLLAAPNRMQIKAIAAACGFPNTRRFRLVFMRLTGRTPTDYRRLYQNQSSS